MVAALPKRHLVAVTKKASEFRLLFFYTLLYDSNEICLIQTFFHKSSFVFSRTNKHIEVWNNMRVSSLNTDRIFILG